jgi:hypothetical protein
VKNRRFQAFALKKMQLVPLRVGKSADRAFPKCVRDAPPSAAVTYIDENVTIAGLPVGLAATTFLTSRYYAVETRFSYDSRHGPCKQSSDTPREWRQNTVHLMTADMVHVNNRVTPGSEVTTTVQQLMMTAGMLSM